MAQNKVQYQHGLPILEFFQTYGSHEQCEALVRSWRWPQGFVCPRCTQTWHSEFRRASRLYAAMHLITQAKNNVSALELKRHLGVSYPTGWLMKHKIMEMMRLRQDDRKLTGRVEIDDAYLGGALPGGSPGRGSENKVSFVAAVHTSNDGQPVLVCFVKVPFTKAALSDFAARSLVRPLTVVSDGLACFTALQDAGVHEPTVTGGGAACVKLPQFKAVNTILGNLKTALAGTYHAFGFAKYAHRYLAQVQYLSNRRFNLRTILTGLARAACVSSPCPLLAIRAAEPSC